MMPGPCRKEIVPNVNVLLIVGKFICTTLGLVNALKYHVLPRDKSDSVSKHERVLAFHWKMCGFGILQCILHILLIRNATSMNDWA